MARPNIIYILCDQMKATASSLYGNAVCRTPALESLAREGVLFSNAYTPSPLCVPARVSMMTGQFPHAHGSRRNEILMKNDRIDLFQIWKGEGYRTGMIGKNHCFPEHRARQEFDIWCEISHDGLPIEGVTWGMPWWRSNIDIEKAHQVRKQLERDKALFSYAVTDYPLEDYSTGLIAGQAVKFLEKHRNEPFALLVSFPDPHPPYEVPRKYYTQISVDQIKLQDFNSEAFERSVPERNRIIHRMLGMGNLSDTTKRSLVATYYAMIQFIDDAVGSIISCVKRLGLWDNTIIVFTSDHGDFSGEHDMVNKGGVFYDCLVHVPLIVCWPSGGLKGICVESMVNLIDIAPTLLHLQGLNIPYSMQGMKLPVVAGGTHRRSTFSEYGAGGKLLTLDELKRLQSALGKEVNLFFHTLKRREAEGRRKMIRTWRWKYIYDPLGDMDELYDMEQDPYELRNLAYGEQYREVIDQMRQEKVDWVIKTEDAVYIPLPDDG